MAALLLLHMIRHEYQLKARNWVGESSMMMMILGPVLRDHERLTRYQRLRWCREHTRARLLRTYHHLLLARPTNAHLIRQTTTSHLRMLVCFLHLIPSSIRLDE